MEMKKFLTVAIVASVVALIFGAVLPVFADTSASEDTFTNEGYFYLDKYTDEYSFYWDSSDPDTFTVNGETVTYHNNSGFAVSLVLGKNFAVRFPSGNTNVSFYGAGTYVSTNAEKPTFTLTYSEGSVTATNGTDTKVISSVTEIYGIVDKGSYVMKKSTEPAYLNSGSEVIADSEIYASGQTFNGSNYIWWHLEGTIDNMEYPEVFNNTYTVTNKQINGEYSSSHEDLYKLNNIQFTVTASNAVVYNVTASYFVVPLEVTAERSVHMDGALATLFNLLPLLIGFGLVIGVAGIVLSRRM